ncbi:hypothetical protein WR164_12960 [Philodulcilactobacillus myokoensis]|uniref:Uncharacterized protein n=1 Tax=Philodulcilactobacillus myokoensis TaxID=2929573 RepID=A0A9W6ETE0_9LACO|nr:hypothetical protein [Philodulcilactobacillus myokoensis]GLB47317.1 hypothetical protein WR164_12960 [Philodulcilactobacillus myokoensis]
MKYNHRINIYKEHPKVHLFKNGFNNGLFYFNILLLIIGYMGLISPNGFNNNVITPIVFIGLLISIFKINYRKEIFLNNKKAISVFVFASIINSIIGVLSLTINLKEIAFNQYYLKILILERIVLIMTVSLLLAVEKIIKNNKLSN